MALGVCCLLLAAVVAGSAAARAEDEAPPLDIDNADLRSFDQAYVSVWLIDVGKRDQLTCLSSSLSNIFPFLP